MIQPITLFELFGDFTNRWPAIRFTETLGSHLTPPDPDIWLANINNGMNLFEVRTGVDDERAAVEAKFAIDLDETIYNGNTLVDSPGIPFVFRTMPEVEFLVQHFPTENDHRARLFAAVSDVGAEVLIEGLPVEIRLPADLIAPHPSAVLDEVEIGQFAPGELDQLKVILRKGEPTSIFVHVRVHMNTDQEVAITPAVPVNFGQCTFIHEKVPCKAVYGFSLIPHTGRAEAEEEWIRHGVTNWFIDGPGASDGCFAVRSIYFDPDESGVSQSIVEKLGKKFDNTPAAEFVVDDLIVPFALLESLFLPRHITTGFRRGSIDPSDAIEVYAFENMPIYFTLYQNWKMYFERFFYASQPLSDLLENPAVELAGGIVHSGPDAESHAITFEFGDQLTLILGYQRNYGYYQLTEPDLENLRDKEKLKDAVVDRLEAELKDKKIRTEEEFLAKVLEAIGPDEFVANENKILKQAQKPLIDEPKGPIEKAFHWEIGGVTIDVMAIKVGFSFGRRMKDEKSFTDSSMAVLDLFVSSPPTGSDDAIVRLRSLSGQPAKFSVEDAGWLFGSPSAHLGAIPEGMRVYIWIFAIIIHKVGLVEEDGGSYFSFSGGLEINPPSGGTAGATVERMRFRIGGNDDAPFFKIDGWFAWIEGASYRVEIGGYRREYEEGDRKIKELALSGLLSLTLGDTYKFGIDFLQGDITSPDENYTYRLIQFLMQAPIPLLAIELRGVHLLWANDLLPNTSIVSNNQPELKYFDWYRASNPLTVSSDRRLNAWQSHYDVETIGLGVQFSIPALSKLMEWSAFVMVLWGEVPTEVLIIAEAYAGGDRKKPIIFGFLEMEWAEDDFNISGILGVDISLQNVSKKVPESLKNVFKLSGTLIFSNDPCTFAIGRFADPRTWLRAVFGYDLITRSFFELAFCIEYVEEPDVFYAQGVTMRIEGGTNLRMIALTYYLGFGISSTMFGTGSKDFACVAFIEAGIRFKAWGMAFGASAKAAFRAVGSSLWRYEISLEFQIDTPWFLPDLTWRLDYVGGEAAPDQLETSATPLRLSWASHAVQRHTAPLHVERFDRDWDGLSETVTYSLQDFQQGGVAESERLSAFANNEDVKPIATDSTVGFGFSVSVNDRLTLGGNIGEFGAQTSGDLDLQYELVGIRVRRRNLLHPDADWVPVMERRAPGADFSAPGGVVPDQAFGPQEFTLFWDPDVKIAGETAGNKLIMNSATPFEFQMSNQRGDEELVENHPAWPCCSSEPVAPPEHEIVFAVYPLGYRLRFPLFFTESRSWLHPAATAFVRPTLYGDVEWGTGAKVAYIRADQPQLLFRATFDESAAFGLAQFACRTRRDAVLRIVGYDADGAECGMQDVVLSGLATFDINLPATGRMRHLEFQLLMEPGEPDPDSQELALVELEFYRFAYIALDDYLNSTVTAAACDPSNTAFQDAWAGRGKLFFLPNHDYEVELTTRVRVSHPSTDEAAADVKEYSYFSTKGLPGLNAQARVGEEVEPYVRGTYTGGHSFLYREEPLALQFSEDFHVAVPLNMRATSSGDLEERNNILVMELTAQPTNTSEPGTARTTTSLDWIVKNRAPGAEQAQPYSWPWIDFLPGTLTEISQAQTIDPARERLGELTQRPEVTCGISDARQVTTPVLVAQPRGLLHPTDVSRQVWPEVSELMATVRPEDAGFIDRRQFDPADLSAFHFASDASPTMMSDWMVLGTELVATGPAGERRYARFGEDNWHHLQMVVTCHVDGNAAGIAVSIPGTSGTPTRALYALVEAVGTGHQLAVYRRAGGTEFEFLAAEVLPELPEGPLMMTVTSYDDRLRVEALETVLEVERSSLRHGQLALVADGQARFTSLTVEGLAIYRFPVALSRYATFQEHVESFEGALGTLPPDAMGAGTTLSDVRSLWGDDVATLAEVMAGDGDPEQRHALFTNWVESLGLPLQDRIEGLDIARILDSNGATSAFLVESAEPLDLVAEVSAELAEATAPDTPTQFLTERPVQRLFAPDGIGDHVVAGDTPIIVHALQGTDRRRAILIPTVNGDHYHLPPGDYKLTFYMHRDRWDTTASPTDVSRYQSSGSVRLTL